MIPVQKSHPPQVIETDLRPISLTPTLSKLFESFIGAWILQRIEHKLGVNQYGALKGRSTTHALVDIVHHWHKVVDEGQSVRAVFIDFAKAFDHVDHNILVAKLIEFGLPDVIIRWMCSFLQHRRQRQRNHWRRDVRLAGGGCWHAARIVSWAVDVHWLIACKLRA